MATGTKARGFLLMANCIPRSSFVNCCLLGSHFLLGGRTKAGTEGIRKGTMALDSRAGEAAVSRERTCGENATKRDVSKSLGSKPSSSPGMGLEHSVSSSPCTNTNTNTLCCVHVAFRAASNFIPLLSTRARGTG
ncbi:uncharacterized [Tachysurus ichikawai]